MQHQLSLQTYRHPSDECEGALHFLEVSAVNIEELCCLLSEGEILIVLLDHDQSVVKKSSSLGLLLLSSHDANSKVSKVLSAQAYADEYD